MNEKALKYMEEAYESDKRILGKDHPDTIITFNQMKEIANIYIEKI